MAKSRGRPKFTTNIRLAVEELTGDKELNLEQCRSWTLFSPVFRSDYEWIKLMDTDGLLVGSRLVRDGEGRDPDTPVELFVGVVVQSEDSTSQSKPNPFGKAAIAHTPNGVWVDTKDDGRRRLDIIHVVMVLPKGELRTGRRSLTPLGET